jgi:hypothetical protein
LAAHQNSTCRLGGSELRVELGNHRLGSVDQFGVGNLPVHALTVDRGLKARRIRDLTVRHHRSVSVQTLLLVELVLILVLLQHLDALLIIHHGRLVLVHLHVLVLDLLLWVLMDVLWRSHRSSSTGRHLSRQIGPIRQAQTTLMGSIDRAKLSRTWQSLSIATSVDEHSPSGSLT